MLRFPSRAATLLAALILVAFPAASETVTLVPGPPRTELGTWKVGRSHAHAGAHPLRPTVRVGDSAVLEVTLPNAGVLRMPPLGITGRPNPLTQSRKGRLGELRPLEVMVDVELPRAFPNVAREAGEIGDGLYVRDTFLGVDEIFVLRSERVEHDLLVQQEAAGRLMGQSLVASWLLQLPSGTKVALEGGEAVIRDSRGTFLARIPAPVVADSGHGHRTLNVAWLELDRDVLSVVVPAAWLHDPARVFPVLVDPTVALQPVDFELTGLVDELGNRQEGPMASGSLLLVGMGGQARAYAEFDTSSIPDGASILDVRLRVWIANHQNPTDPSVCLPPEPGPVACPLELEVKHVAVRSTVPNLVLHAAIPGLNAGRIYSEEELSDTGPEWCPEYYVFRDYDLGAMADDDVEAQLAADFFTLGFVTSVETDLLFDHIDEIGWPEEVDSFSDCLGFDFPGSRITLVVVFGQPPQCDAGGPYTGDCPSDPILLDGTGSSDPDGDVLTYAWTKNCSGTIENANQAQAILHLDPSCAETCQVFLSVSDGTSSAECEATVVVADVSPPTITGNALDSLCLWPPRHDFYCLGPPESLVTAQDSCQEVVLTFLGCVSDQPDEAPEEGRPENGDGHFTDDCQVSDDGRELCVRVERAGTDPEGRHYGVMVLASDGCGNSVVVGGNAFVPHDRRGGSGGQDDPCQRGNRRKHR